MSLFENPTRILDNEKMVTTYTARENIPGRMFAADYAAVFDILDNAFVNSLLKLLNFPEYFINWIRILQTDLNFVDRN